MLQHMPQPRAFVFAQAAYEPAGLKVVSSAWPFTRNKPTQSNQPLGYKAEGTVERNLRFAALLEVYLQVVHEILTGRQVCMHCQIQ